MTILKKILPKTVEEFSKLSINIQGALWPTCKSCRHIAQSHDTHKSKPLVNNCHEYGPGKCSSCGNWTSKVQCTCTGYDGPENVEELIKYLNKTE